VVHSFFWMNFALGNQLPHHHEAAEGDLSGGWVRGRNGRRQRNEYGLEPVPGQGRGCLLFSAQTCTVGFYNPGQAGAEGLHPRLFGHRSALADEKD